MSSEVQLKLNFNFLPLNFNQKPEGLIWEGRWKTLVVEGGELVRRCIIELGKGVAEEQIHPEWAADELGEWIQFASNKGWVLTPEAKVKNNPDLRYVELWVKKRREDLVKVFRSAQEKRNRGVQLDLI